MNDKTLNRRDLCRLALAALRGLTASALGGCSGGTTPTAAHDRKANRTARRKRERPEPVAHAPGSPRSAIMTIPNNSWHDLGQIQRWMQAAIMHPVGVAEGIASAEARGYIDVGPDEAETVVTRSRALSALERLTIYGYAYYARLLECLREEYPVLKHALGEEVFDAFAVGYLQQYPSRSYTLFQLGAHFPRYLAETRPDGTA